MTAIVSTNFADVQYVLEVGGSKHSEYAYFVEAIEAGLLLREQNPKSLINVRDVSASKDQTVSGMATQSVDPISVGSSQSDLAKRANGS